MDIDDDEAVREGIREIVQDMAMPEPWADGVIADDPGFVAKCLTFLEPGATVLGSRLERREAWGLVYLVDYRTPDFPDAGVSRLVLWERDGGLGTLALCARDGGPLPGCDYALE